MAADDLFEKEQKEVVAGRCRTCRNRTHRIFAFIWLVIEIVAFGVWCCLVVKLLEQGAIDWKYFSNKWKYEGANNSINVLINNDADIDWIYHTKLIENEDLINTLR